MNQENNEKSVETPPQSFLDKFANYIFNFRSYFNKLVDRVSNIEKSNMEAGIQQLRKGQFKEARIRFGIVTKLNHKNAIAHYLRGKCSFYLQKNKDAIQSFRQALKLNPNLEEAKFLVAACGAPQEIKSIPRSFVIEKSDNLSTILEYFQDNFSSKLNVVLAEEFKKILGEKLGFNVLELGTHGGDSAEIFRNYANSIVGVEPSLKLLALDRNRRVENLLTYNLLVGKFPEDYLKESKEKFYVVLSTYYFDNLGDLNEIFGLVHNALEDKGLFAFNVNKFAKTNFEFKPKSLLFSHSPEFIKSLLQKHGFNLIVEKEVSYEDSGTDILYIVEKI